MRAIQTLLLAGLIAASPACMATKIVTVPVGLAVGATKVATKSVVYVGGTAVRVTGDALDGPDKMVHVDVTMKSGKHVRKTVKAKYLERELDKLGKKGRIVDVEVTPAD